MLLEGSYLGLYLFLSLLLFFFFVLFVFVMYYKQFLFSVYSDMFAYSFDCYGTFSRKQGGFKTKKCSRFGI